MNNSQSKCKCSAAVLAYSVAILGAFLIVAGLAWLMYSSTRPAPLGEDRSIARKKALTDLRSANAETLNSYGWQDQAKGIVRLPIDQAMKLAEQKWQNPAAAHLDLSNRVEKATAVPPKAPEKPSQFE
ncbi:MAG: hypothetical protein JWQ71_4688 [Pedosphaera sp.]|nr:hypothetical protein [Pedosphaera sp.]